MQDTDREQVQIQVFLSEYTINTALSKVHDAGLIEFHTRVSSTYLKTFFPNWEEVFGKHPSIKMTLQSKSAPQLNLRQSASKIYADTFIRIHNPYTDEYDAVTITCAIVFSLEFDLLNDATIAGKITEMEPSVTDLKVYFVSDYTKESMNLQV